LIGAEREYRWAGTYDVVRVVPHFADHMIDRVLVIHASGREASIAEATAHANGAVGQPAYTWRGGLFQSTSCP
jgi:hypothetical protein